MTSEAEDRLCTPDDRELFLRDEGKPDCETAMLVVHGLGEHSGCYDDFNERMLAKNRGVLVYDQRGHGKSPGRRGDAPDFNVWVFDQDIEPGPDQNPLESSFTIPRWLLADQGDRCGTDERSPTLLQRQSH